MFSQKSIEALDKAILEADEELARLEIERIIENLNEQ